MSDSEAAFDRVAARYDAEATDVALSRWLRGQVWARLALMFRPGDHVLEIGCGTGEDAIWLAGRGVRVTATDVSQTMLEHAANKAAQVGAAGMITFQRLDLADAANWPLPDATFDGVTSNYGPLNCIGDWRALGTTLARIVRPGSRLGFAVMGPFCLWETLWHGLHLDFRTAARRWRGQAMAHIGGVSFPVYYPTPGRLLHDLGPHFRRRDLRGLGVFVPPSDVYKAVGRRKRLAQVLIQLETVMAHLGPFKYIGDHYWQEVERSP